MKNKDIRKEGRRPKEKRTGLDVFECLEPVDNPPIQDAKYRIEYGRHFKATVTYLDGTLKGKTATYDGRLKKWSGINVPNTIKSSIEYYYNH